MKEERGNHESYYSSFLARPQIHNLTGKVLGALSVTLVDSKNRLIGTTNFLSRKAFNTHLPLVTVQLTYCLTGLNSTQQVNLLIILTKQSCQIQIGGQPYSDYSPHEVSEYSCKSAISKLIYNIYPFLIGQNRD